MHSWAEKENYIWQLRKQNTARFQNIWKHKTRNTLKSMEWNSLKDMEYNVHNKVTSLKAQYLKLTVPYSHKLKSLKKEYQEFL